MLREVLRKPIAKLALVLVSLGPLAWLCTAIFLDRLGPNPAEYLIRSTGDWTLRFLCITLCVTPLRVTFNIPEFLRFRRSLGLLTFFYVLLHALCYGLFDMGLEWNDIVSDILKRPFIAVGFAAAVMLSLLAATSFNAAIKKMGAVRWRKLHRLVYAIAVLAILHFFWMRAGKKNFTEVFVYAGLLSVLLGWRVWQAAKQRRRSGP
jgi:methionine sulfoxide reductase heme-binding subunit